MLNIHLHNTSVNPSIRLKPPHFGGVMKGTIMTTISVNTPVQANSPRGAEWFASAFAACLNWAEKVGTARAERYIAATTVKRVAEAAELRTYAQSVSQHDRSFAADLFAAADRHERND